MAFQEERWAARRWEYQAWTKRWPRERRALSVKEPKPQGGPPDYRQSNRVQGGGMLPVQRIYTSSFMPTKQRPDCLRSPSPSVRRCKQCSLDTHKTVEMTEKIPCPRLARARH